MYVQNICKIHMLRTEVEGIMRAFTEFFGLAILIAFTSIVISISILSQGAYLYYYEPNKFAWIAEVLLGICGVIVGIGRIKERLKNRETSGVI